MDPAGLVNWRRIDDRLTTSGQPDETQLAAIRDLGATTVINLALHTHPRALPDEAASVAGLGMLYVHIPVEFDAPREEDYRRFTAALAQAQTQGERVHVHCIVNARVSAFLFRQRTETGAATPEQARAEMESVWRPGGVWARFIGEPERGGDPHLYAGPDY